MFELDMVCSMVCSREFADGSWSAEVEVTRKVGMPTVQRPASAYTAHKPRSEQPL